jgi:hypothetical protein
VIIRQKPRTIDAQSFLRSGGILAVAEMKDPQEALLTEDQLTFQKDRQHDKDPKRDAIICCRACRQIITKDEFSIAMEGNHEHIQCNPYGVTFVFRCFNQVWHCLPVGDPQSAHSWFPGFYWTLVLCESCTTHLGWQFHNSENSVFWGLISERLCNQPLSE